MKPNPKAETGVIARGIKGTGAWAWDKVGNAKDTLIGKVSPTTKDFFNQHIGKIQNSPVFKRYAKPVAYIAGATGGYMLFGTEAKADDSISIPQGDGTFASSEKLFPTSISSKNKSTNSTNNSSTNNQNPKDNPSPNDRINNKTKHVKTPNNDLSESNYNTNNQSPQNQDESLFSDSNVDTAMTTAALGFNAFTAKGGMAEHAMVKAVGMKTAMKAGGKFIPGGRVRDGYSNGCR